jgi:hypothetical protein
MEWLWGDTASVQDRRSPFPLGMGSRHACSASPAVRSRVVEPLSKQDGCYGQAEIAMSKSLTLKRQEIAGEHQERGDRGWSPGTRSNFGKPAQRKQMRR